MWKCTGSCRSAHTSQNGSHARLARSGAPRSWGSVVMLMPRHPSAATRLASATQASMFHAGMSGMGSRRLFDSAWISAMPSL